MPCSRCVCPPGEENEKEEEAAEEGVRERQRQRQRQQQRVQIQEEAPYSLVRQRGQEEEEEAQEAQVSQAQLKRPRHWKHPQRAAVRPAAAAQAVGKPQSERHTFPAARLPSPWQFSLKNPPSGPEWKNDFFFSPPCRRRRSSNTGRTSKLFLSGLPNQIMSTQQQTEIRGLFQVMPLEVTVRESWSNLRALAHTHTHQTKRETAAGCMKLEQGNQYGSQLLASAEILLLVYRDPFSPALEHPPARPAYCTTMRVCV